MEALFRLVLTRPAVAQDDKAPSISLSQNSDFQAALGQAGAANNPKEASKAAARKFSSTVSFLADPEKLPNFRELKKLRRTLSAIEQRQDYTNEHIATAIEDIFGADAAAIVASNQYQSAVLNLKDSLMAIKLLPELHGNPIEALTNLLRDLEVIAAVADGVDFADPERYLRRFRRRSVKLPTQKQLRSTLSTVQKQRELEAQRQKEAEQKRKDAEEKLARYQKIREAIEELGQLDSQYFISTDQQANSGFLVPAAYRPTQVFIQNMMRDQQLSQLDLMRRQASFSSQEDQEKISARSLLQAQAVSADSSELNRSARLFVTGKGPFKPQQRLEVGFRLRANVAPQLSETTRAVLKEYRLDLADQPLDQVVARLQQELQRLSADLDSLLGRPLKRSFKRIGNTVVMTKSAMPSVWNSLVIGAVSPDILYTIFDSRVPHTHGDVAPAGIADLLVVKQQLVRYEGADLAHIENILKGEKKEREHTRRRETEELLFRETEITTSEERELESTSRFEMSRETSATIKEDASLKAGLTVSGKYGPVVEFSASAEGSISRSKEEATKTAAKFSQDVTERSANKITQRVLERSSLRVTNEVIDRNAHAIDNTAGDGHISGVYQWVNKVYQAQIYNYGIRTMFDFMVPEPAAFLIETLQSAHANAVELEKPPPFTLRPDQITEYNYHSWIQLYGATDVQPAPEIYVTKSLDFKAGGGDDKTDYTHSGQLQVTEGYKAVHGSVGIAANVWEDNATVDVVLGDRTHRFDPGLGVGGWTTSLSNETDSLPFALCTWKYSDIAVAVEVKCQRTERAMLKWRLDTHAKLTNAYKARLSEYEEKLAALELQAGVAISGKNPGLNLELIKDELKKNCISILTEQHFDLFNAITTGTTGLPQINLFENEAEGPYVRFFEQAFEWEHMTWVTYPYFWGRKQQWDERVSYEDNDPLFNQFLKAGYCRVAVPARPGFEGAIDHFMTFGEPWDGGPLPPISSPLYLPIADEIAERLDRPGDEIPEGEPWLVRIPTTLVHLRADDQLPRWVQNDEGEWIEENLED